LRYIPFSVRCLSVIRCNFCNAITWPPFYPTEPDNRQMLLLQWELMTIDSVCGFSSAKNFLFFFSEGVSCCCHRAIGYVSCLSLSLFLLFLQYTHDFRKMPYILWSRCRAHGSKKSLFLLPPPLFSSLPRLACCHFVISKIAKSQCKPRPVFSLPSAPPLRPSLVSLYE
jgi:hypothetical protein